MKFRIYPEFLQGTIKKVKKTDLIDFEEEIAELFLEKRIRAPIHLSRGNEEPLIEIFKQVKPEDWVCSTHRSHYHALLKGISPQWLKAEILAGRSMHIMSAFYYFFSSAIVGGNLPIAVGLAMGIKMGGENRQVWCFCGDMAAEHGGFCEATKYTKNFNLPICFVIEDNNLSTNTPTRQVWGIREKPTQEGEIIEVDSWESGKILRYFYTRQCEHVGVGKWVNF